ncbi:MAG TPA: Holliday junction resolvase RuvX [Pyrinomonadaceae bacterium]|nr:Holliday junction resolvase RuvX [Pyrinomonadaceae bacterium]
MNEHQGASIYDYVKQEGRILALDTGRKRIGVAISDEMGVTARPLPALQRTSWKRLLNEVARLVRDFDAKRLVIGLPLNMDGTEGKASGEVRELYRKFSLSLEIPVCLQDERLTSREAEERLRRAGRKPNEVADMVDSEAAVIILQDFLASERGDKISFSTYS